METSKEQKLKDAKSLEELKKLAEQDGCELSDDQLDGVAGGEGCGPLTIKPGMMPV
ncbi:MAG: hypothetical protein J5486_02165 [Bacteroidaceae bacterium]|nr:hypothetical protein [Bacteroidaceae bacterium]